jgi:hypothetical protein
MVKQHDLKLDGRELALSTPIWRYIKLSTLIYLLKEQRSFIPKLTTLQKDDPFEGRQSIYAGHQDFACLGAKLRKETLWLLRTKADGGTLANWEMQQGMQPSLAQIWMRELARRRVVWCWHESESECMGQWRIYGKEAGVAIRSDVGSVLRLLNGEGNNRDIAYGRIRYLVPNQPLDIEEPSAKEMAWNPIFIKNTVFAHEKEVRFVLPDGPWDYPGYPIHTQPNEFVKKIILSPFFISSEGLALKAVIESLLKLILPVGGELPEVKLSGALNIDNPEGQTERSLKEVVLESSADDWIASKPCKGLDEENNAPAILDLFPNSVPN